MKHPIKIIVYIVLLALFGFVIYKVTRTPENSVKVEAGLAGQEPQQEEVKAEDVTSESTVKEAVVANQSVDKAKKAKKSKGKTSLKSRQQAEIARRAVATFQPLPTIPEELRYEALKTQAKARLFVNANGEVTTVEFIKPSNEPKLNHLLERSLRKWKFKPGTISFIQDINVTFKVE